MAKQQSLHPGARIRRARRLIEMTQMELGHAVGRDGPFVSGVESGKRPASQEMLAKMWRAIAEARGRA